MIKLLIAVPSLGRPEAILKKTYKLLDGFEVNSNEIHVDFKVFVEPIEYMMYKRNIPAEHLVKLAESRKGLMNTLNFIREYANNHEYDYLFQMDDDVECFERVDTKDKHEALRLTIVDIVNTLKMMPNVAGVRFTQYRYWVYSKKDMKKWTHVDKPLQGVCILRVSSLRQIDPGLKEFTDTVTSLYLFKDGYHTLNYGYSGLKVVQNANKGGCQSFNRATEARETISLLKKYFPLVFEKDSSSWFGIDVDVDDYTENQRPIHKMEQDLNFLK